MTDNVAYKKPPKSPAAAGILSGIFPGVGQIYNGEYMKGILYIIIFAGLITLQPHSGQPFIAITLAGFYFFQLLEAIQTAKKINLAAAGQPAAAVSPAGTATPLPAKPEPKSGSVFWGLCLMALGVVFLLGNFDILDYDRLFDFWPVLVIIIGLKMIFDYFVKKKD
jgi:hypothetical protein